MWYNLETKGHYDEIQKFCVLRPELVLAVGEADMPQIILSEELVLVHSRHHSPAVLYHGQTPQKVTVHK